MERGDLKRIDDVTWEIPKTGAMRVPGRIFASSQLMREIEKDRSPWQVANVAHLPGIVNASLAMPDCHWGYGAPVGGVAAMDAKQGVVSPGMVGYDISCGVRTLTTGLRREGMFGAADTPGVRVGTEWNTGDIWIRREFNLDRVPKEAMLNIYHDENAEAFINGKQVAATEGYTTGHVLIPIDTAPLRKGRNTIAIHCHQTQGGQAHALALDPGAWGQAVGRGEAAGEVA